MRKVAVPVVLLAGFALTLRAAAPSAELDTLLRTAVEKKRLPLVVAMVADARGTAYEHATGSPKDAIFGIASMTKPITSVAVMQLVEAGRVKLDEAASSYLPELRDVRVLDAGTERPPKTKLTVRHLLTHTSGFGYEFMNRELFGLVAKKAIPSAMAGGDAFLRAPLLFDPGARWEYGISTDWLGKLVERVSGQSLEVYFRDRIFRPLGMSDSFFVVPADKQARLVRHFQRTGDGVFAEQPRPPQKSDGFFSGGGGLYSTAHDYLRFVRALMAGGRLDDQRILSEDSVAMMGKNQIGDLTIRPLPSMIPQFITDHAALPGDLDKFGLGFAINSRTAGSGRGANSMAWAGAMNTFFWIDREKQIGAVLFSQVLPYLDAETAKVLGEFDRAVYGWKAR
jgi:CubicO group peptidase (beta-lactamase class C family)